MSEHNKFRERNIAMIARANLDEQFESLSRSWFNKSHAYEYSYHFEWMGRPIIQYPQDIVAMQELIWEVKPDLIVEMGIAHGGSLIFSASMLALLDYCEAAEAAAIMDPANPKRQVLAVDIDIREHNRTAIEAHPMSNRITMIQGSSILPDVIDRVCVFARDYGRILVCLDSNHTHEHVLAELEAYAPLTSKGSYCCVFDTVIEDMPAEMFPDRPWGPGNNPKTAVWEYLKKLETGTVKAADGDNLRFEVDEDIEKKILISVAPNGYLRRI